MTSQPISRDRLAFLQSLGARTVLFAVLPTVLILLGIVAYTAITMSGAVRDEAERNLQSLAIAVAGEIERSNAEAVLAAQMMAHAQGSAGLFGKREESVALARRVLEAHPAFTGAYFGYEPNADGGDAAARALPETSALAAAHDADGRFLPYWYRGQGDSAQILLDPLLDMETSLYYQGCKELFLQRGDGHSMVTEPYVYDGKMIVEQTHPIVIDGRFAGIAGVDRALTDIAAFLEQIKARSDVDILLVSRARRFIATTTPEADALITRGVDTTAYAELFGPLLEDRDVSRLELAPDPADGEAYYFATAPVPTGTWTVVVRKLERDIVAPIDRSVRTDLALAALGVILVIGLSLWTNRSITERLGRAVAAADAVASGDLASGVSLDTSGRDEVTRLMTALRQMVGNLQDKMAVIDSISRGDYSRRVDVVSAQDALGSSLREMLEGLRRIVAHTKRLAAGDYSQLLEPHSDDDELVHSINDMTRALADAQQRLEQRVQQRTDELNEYARELEAQTAQLRRVTEASEARARQESSLSALTTHLQGNLTVEEVAQRALDRVVEFVEAPVGAIYVMESDGRLHRHAAHALPPGARELDSFSVGTGSVGQVAESRRVSVFRGDNETFPVAFGLTQVSPRRVLTIPLVANDVLAGVAELYLMDDLGEDASDWLHKACDIAAVALRLAVESREREAAQEQTRLILESSGEGLFGLDTEGRATFVNSVACQLLGFEAEELVGKPTHALIHHSHPDGSPYPATECPMREAFTVGVVTRVDDEVLWHKDGHALPVEYTSTPIMQGDEILGAVISFRDITERRQAEARLRAQEEQVRNLLDSAPDAMVVVDEDGAIAMVNRQTETLFGYGRDEMIGERVEMLMPGRFRTGHPQLRRSFMSDSTARRMGSGMELVAAAKDGTEFPVEVSLSPIDTPEGRMVASALRDVTERTAMERESRQTQQRMAALFNALPVGVVMIEPTGKIVQANHLTESILGISADEHRMRDLQSQEWRIVREDGSPMPVEEYPASRAMAGEGEVRNVVMGVHRPQGDVVWISTSAAPIDQEAGGGVAVAFEDITSRRELVHRERMLASLREVVWKMSDGGDVESLLEQLRTVLEDTGMPLNAFGVNVVEDEERERVRIYGTAKEGWRDDVTDPVNGRKIIEFWRAGRTMYRPDLQSEDEHGEIQNFSPGGARSIIDVPFSHGTLAANSKQPDAFADHIDLLESIAGVLSEGFRRLDDLKVRREQERRDELLGRLRTAVWSLDTTSGTADLLKQLGKVLDDSGVPYRAYGVNVIEGRDPIRVRAFTSTDEGIIDEMLTDEVGEIVIGFSDRAETIYRKDLKSEDQFGEMSHGGDGENVWAGLGAPRCIVDVPFSHGTFAANSDEADAFGVHIGLLEQIAGVLSEGFRRLDDLRARRDA